MAQVYELACLNNVRFQPSGDAAADPAAWQDFVSTLRAHVHCVKLLAIDGGIRGHEVAMAFLALANHNHIAYRGCNCV